MAKEISKPISIAIITLIFLAAMTVLYISNTALLNSIRDWMNGIYPKTIQDIIGNVCGVIVILYLNVAFLKIIFYFYIKYKAYKFSKTNRASNTLIALGKAYMANQHQNEAGHSYHFTPSMKRLSRHDDRHTIKFKRWELFKFIVKMKKSQKLSYHDCLVLLYVDKTVLVPSMSAHDIFFHRKR